MVDRVRGSEVVADLDAAPIAAVVDLVRTGRAVTRPQLVDATGLSRKVVVQKVSDAIEMGLIEDGPLAPSEGGRKAGTLRFRPDAGVILASWLSYDELVVGTVTLAGQILTLEKTPWTFSSSPEETMQRMQGMLESQARKAGRPWAIALGIPGSVDYAAGRLVELPLAPGWSGFNPRSWLRANWDCPVWVDNDVHLMALNTWTTLHPQPRDLLYIEVGNTVGAGLVFNGSVIRGVNGGAGMIGHIRVTDDADALCRCGKTGCLEAVASGWQVLDDATARAPESDFLARVIRDHGRLTLPDIGAAASMGDVLVLELLQHAAERIGNVIASLVDFSNPATLVVGGGVLRAGPVFLDVVTRVVRQRCSALALRDLEILSATLDLDREILRGGAQLAIEALLNPVALSRWIAHGTPHGHASELHRLASR